MLSLYVISARIIATTYPSKLDSWTTQALAHYLCQHLRESWIRISHSPLTGAITDLPTITKSMVCLGGPRNQPPAHPPSKRHSRTASKLAW